MEECAVIGKERIAVEQNALPHAVPPRATSEKAPGYEPARAKKGSIGSVAKHCFQSGLQKVRAVPRQLLRDARAQPATMQRRGMELPAHCAACSRAGFVGRTLA